MSDGDTKGDDRGVKQEGASGEGVVRTLEDGLAQLSLDALRADLIRLEETIIFGLIERAQFRFNQAVYVVGGVSDKLDEPFLDFFLLEIERLHSRMRRYSSPDEQPFFPEKLLPAAIPLLNYPEVIIPNNINYNDRVKSIYLHKILPRICQPGDDQQYGSSVLCDIQVLQAISKRVHYGKFVAEAKFREDPVLYSELIRNRDADGITQKLTNKEVERRLLERVRIKASTYGRDLNRTPTSPPSAPAGEASQSQTPPSYKVDPELIVFLYRDFLIPITIDIEVAYLLQRLEKPRVAFLGPETTFSHQAALAFFSSPNQTKSDFDFVPVSTIPEVFRAVLSNSVNYGVVPIENSHSGRVIPTMEQLYDTTAKMIGEVYIPIHHNILAKPSTDPARIRRIYSHQQALAQCKNWLATRYPEAELVEVSSTARAAELVSQLPDDAPASAAIASSLAARKFNLSVLEQGIQDGTNNRTRFLVVGKKIGSVSGKDKSILTFKTSNTPGALSNAINAFAQNGLNLIALESYPNRLEPWSYNFFVEVEGHVDDESFQKCLQQLSQVTEFVRILGAFPAKHRG